MLESCDDSILSTHPSTVHGFAQAVYNVSEEDILNTRFELNAKGVTNFPSVVNIQGTITAAAGGTASEYSLMCPSPHNKCNFKLSH